MKEFFGGNEKQESYGRSKVSLALLKSVKTFDFPKVLGSSTTATSPIEYADH